MLEGSRRPDAGATRDAAGGTDAASPEDASGPLVDAGDDASEPPDANSSPFRGCYTGSYTGIERGDLEIVINADRTVTLVASGALGGRVYEGTVDETGFFSATSTVTDGASAQVTFTGVLPMSRGGEQGGEWNTSIGLAGEWQVTRDRSVGVFAGSYDGTFDGDDRGTIDVAITCNGTVSVLVESFSLGAFTLIGTIEPDGRANASGTVSGAIGVDYAGRFESNASGEREGRGNWNANVGTRGRWEVVER